MWKLPEEYLSLVKNCSQSIDYILIENPSKSFLQSHMLETTSTTYYISRNSNLIWQLPTLFNYPILLFRRKISWIPTDGQNQSHPFQYCFMVVINHKDVNHLVKTCKPYGTMLLDSKVL